MIKTITLKAKSIENGEIIMAITMTTIIVTTVIMMIVIVIMMRIRMKIVYRIKKLKKLK